jgi:hypothetical protein
VVYDHLQALKWVFLQWIKSLAPRAIVEILGTGLNLCEEAIEFVRSEINIVDAAGLHLEAIGAKFGVARAGMDDDVLRAAIIVEARSLFASGDSAAFIGMFRTILPDALLHESEFYPHCFVYFVQDAKLEMLDVLASLLSDAEALTVNGAIGYVELPVLTFGSASPGPAIEISGGFGSASAGDPIDTPAGFGFAIPL